MIRPVATLKFAPLGLHAYNLSLAFHYETPAELFTLMAFAWGIPQERPVIVNIGAGAGTSSMAFAEARPDANVITVDISAGGPLGGLQNELNAFRESGLKPPYQVLGDSKDIGKAWNRGPLNLVYIDGDHSFEGCLGDIMSWRDHILPGGFLLLHDYTRAEWPDVYRAVKETDALDGFDEIMVVETVWAGRKKT